MAGRRLPLGLLPFATGLFWALVAGFLPLPALTWFFGIDRRLVGWAVLADWSWVVAASIVAAAVATLLAVPFKRHLRLPVSLLLWILIGWLALPAGQFAGLLANLLARALVYSQPFAFNAQRFAGEVVSPGVVAPIALFGLLPVTVIGLASYPVLVYLRRRSVWAGNV